MFFSARACGAGRSSVERGSLHVVSFCLSLLGAVESIRTKFICFLFAPVSWTQISPVELGSFVQAFFSLKPLGRGGVQ